MAAGDDALGRGALLMPSDDELKEAIMMEDQKRNASVLLYMLESKINSEFVDSDFSNGFSDFVVEQIMPEKGNDSWATTAYTNEDRDRLTRTIGNFVLLREKLKTADKKADWMRKKDAMKEKSKEIETSAIVARNLGTFTEETIEKRNQWIADKAIEVWPL